MPSGAIELTIHEMIPTLHEGLGPPETLRIVTGVVGQRGMACVYQRC